MDDLWQYFGSLKEDPFYITCTICAKKFKGWKRSTLEEHLKTKHSIKVLTKPSLPMNHFSKSTIEWFDKMERKHLNEQVKKFDRIEEMTEHHSSVHEEEKPLNDLAKNLYLCPICQEKFADIEELTGHYSSVHVEPIFNRRRPRHKIQKSSSEAVILTRSKKKSLTYKKIQIDMLMRLPHIGKQIFDSVDNSSLLKCKETSRTWYDFIDEQKFSWVRIIQKYVKESNKNYTECPKHWRKLFRKSSVEQVKYLASKIHEDVLFARKHGFTHLSHDGKELTPLHFAVMFTHSYDSDIINGIIKGFLEVDKDKNSRDKNGDTPLHTAARNGNLDITQLIIETIEDKNPKNNNGETPLHTASFDGNIKIVELILKNISDKNPGNQYMQTPLHYAAITGRLDIFKLIFNSVGKKNPKDFIGNTPLHKAADGGSGPCIRCHPELRFKKENYNHPEICRLILDNVKEKNTENHFGKTPLLLAIESNHTSVIDILTPKYVKKRKTNENQNSSKAKRFKNE